MTAASKKKNERFKYFFPLKECCRPQSTIFENKNISWRMEKFPTEHGGKNLPGRDETKTFTEYNQFFF